MDEQINTNFQEALNLMKDAVKLIPNKADSAWTNSHIALADQIIRDLQVLIMISKMVDKK